MPEPTTAYNNKPTGIEAKILFSRFADRIKAWYEDPANISRFEEWQKKRCENIEQ